MSLAENKGLVFGFGILFALLVISVLLNFFFVSGNYDYALKNNKVFNISVEKNKESNQFVFSTKNYLKRVNNLLKFIPNISFIVFDIDANDRGRVSDLIELQSDVKFGFLNFNNNLLDKLHYFGNSFLLHLNFKDNNQDNLFIDINKDLDGNADNIMKIESIIEKYNSGLYVNFDDIKKIDGNQKFIDFLVKFNPFVVNDVDSCSEKTHICFIISNDVLADTSFLKFQDVLNQTKLNEKWLIAIKYQSKFETQIKNLINSTNSGFLEINKNLLDNILNS
jgi:hypothetical protein